MRVSGIYQESHGLSENSGTNFPRQFKKSNFWFCKFFRKIYFKFPSYPWDYLYKYQFLKIIFTSLTWSFSTGSRKRCNQNHTSIYFNIFDAPMILKRSISVNDCVFVYVLWFVQIKQFHIIKSQSKLLTLPFLGNFWPFFERMAINKKKLYFNPFLH